MLFFSSSFFLFYFFFLPQSLITINIIFSFLTFQNRVTCVCFSPNMLTLVSGSLDCTVRTWDLRTCTCTSILTGHNCPIGGELCVVTPFSGTSSDSLSCFLLFLFSSFLFFALLQELPKAHSALSRSSS